jgi:Bacteriophage HK97-gp10, putative tail-component
VTVVVHTEAVERMLAELEEKAANLVLEKAAEKALGTVSGIPVDTGELAASLHVKAGKDPRGQPTARIVSDVEYAGFVFHGHRDRGGGWVEPQPPQIGYSAQDLAADVTEQLGLND